MDKECYKDIEKIKTIGSTYMAAVGLLPTIGTKVSFSPLWVCAFVCVRVRFCACVNGCVLGYL